MMQQSPYNWNPPPSPSFPVGKKELLFAAGALLCGMMLCNFTLFGGWNLGFALAAWGCIFCAFGYLFCTGCRPDPYSVSLLVLCLCIAAGFARSADDFVKLVLLFFLLAGVCLALSITAKKNRFSAGGICSLADAFCALFLHGPGSMPPALRGLRDALRRSGEVGKKGGAFVLGLVIAVPVLAITLPLLIQADAAFDELIAMLPEFDFAELFATVLFGTGLGLWLFSMGTSLRHKPAEMTAQSRSSFRLSPITVNTVLTSLCIVYGAYLFSQLAYFSGGFAGILPDGYSLSEYARRGFFEMALLSAINLVVITGLLGFVKKQPHAPLSTRLLCLFLGLVTLFLITSACAKMFLYVESYAMTRLRLLTLIVMAFLAVTTLAVVLWMFLPRLPYMKVVVLTALLLGALTIWLDVDAQVARYNVDAYLSGKLETVDVTYLSRLNSSAMPQIERLAQQAQDASVARSAKNMLRCRYIAKDFRSWNYANAVTSRYAGEKAE